MQHQCWFKPSASGHCRIKWTKTSLAYLQVCWWLWSLCIKMFPGLLTPEQKVKHSEGFQIGGNTLYWHCFTVTKSSEVGVGLNGIASYHARLKGCLPRQVGIMIMRTAYYAILPHRCLHVRVGCANYSICMEMYVCQTLHGINLALAKADDISRFLILCRKFLHLCNIALQRMLMYHLALLLMANKLVFPRAA